MRLLSSFSLRLCALGGLLLVASPALYADDTTPAPLQAEKPRPRIAMWNPQMSSAPDKNGVDEINIDQDRISRIQNWLRFEKADATLLRTDEMSDPEKFNADKFDAIFLSGDALPRWLVKPLKEFAQQGGILVAINARNQPWSLPLTPDVNGRWRAQAKGKRMNELTDLFGSHWGNLSDANGANAHYFAETLWKNLPAPPVVKPRKGEPVPEVIEPDYNQPVLDGFLPAPKVTVDAGTILRPLVISRVSETDKTEKTPQAFMMQKDNAKALVVCNTYWSGSMEDGGYDKGLPFWNAIAIICRDWRSGDLVLK